MAELFANNAKSTLSGTITALQTTITVASAATFPVSGNFRIRIEDEFMLVTGVVGATFTVTRGIEGSTAASHASGSLVTHVLTAQALEGLAFTAGGDLSGTSSSQTVIQLQSRAVSSTAPTLNQVLTWNGTTWTPAAPPSSPPGGANTQLQWNNASTFGGISGFTTDGTFVTVTTALKLGTGPFASTGFLRLPNVSTPILARNAANSADLALIATNASDNLFLGSDASLGSQFNAVKLYTATGGDLGVLTSSVLGWTSSAVNVSVPALWRFCLTPDTSHQGGIRQHVESKNLLSGAGHFDIGSFTPANDCYMTAICVVSQWSDTVDTHRALWRFSQSMRSVAGVLTFDTNLNDDVPEDLAGTGWTHPTLNDGGTGNLVLRVYQNATENSHVQVNFQLLVNVR